MLRSVLPNSIHRFTSIPIKIPASYFVDIDKPSLYGEAKDLNSRRDIKEQSQRSTLPNFKIYYKDTVIKTYGIKRVDWSMEQKSPKLDPHKYGQRVFYKRTKATQ